MGRKDLRSKLEIELYDMARRIFLGSNRNYLKNHGLFIDNLYFPCIADIICPIDTSIERLWTRIKLVLHNLYTSYNILYLHTKRSIRFIQSIRFFLFSVLSRTIQIIQIYICLSYFALVRFIFWLSFVLSFWIRWIRKIGILNLFCPFWINPI